MANQIRRFCGLSALLIAMILPARADDRRNEAAQLAGGRSLEFVRVVSSERDVNLKRGFWSKFVDVVAGAPKYHRMVRPYGVTTNSHGAIVVSDPGAEVVHVFDLEAKKYHLLKGSGREHFRSPLGVTTDGEDNVYVTDSYLGKIFVYDRHFKFLRCIGEKGGEGIFKRPTGIVVDNATAHIYVSDTLRHKIFMLDRDGNVLSSFGKRGAGRGEFNFPTELAMRGDELLVVDAMNFRVQILDRQGGFRSVFGELGDSNGTLNRVKGVAVDSEGDIYLAEALFETVQLFNRSGELLYYFGRSGVDDGEFQLPSGLSVDKHDRVYVVDSLNRRIQVFQFKAASKRLMGDAR